MKDRVSTKILNNGATRYGVYDETENLLRYEYIKLEDEPTVEGDFFNKANMLPDHIPALLGLKMGNPQVKDALNVLANVGNLHVWERVQTYSEPVPEVPAGYTLGEVETDVVISRGGTTTIGWITDPSMITVEYDGTVVFPSNSSGSTKSVSDWAKYTYYSDMQGKYCHVSQEAGTHVNGITFFFPSNASLSNVSGTGLVASKLQRVIGYPYTPAIPAGTTTDYLTSTDRNAYPDQSAEGGQDAYYTLGDVVSGNFALGNTSTTVRMVYDVSDSVTVSESIEVIQDSPTEESVAKTGTTSTVVSDIDTARTTFSGKFVAYKRMSGGTLNTSGKTLLPGEIVFIPSDANFTLDADGKWLFVDKYQPVHGHAAIPANTTITYLGQLGGRARIEVGSYVGTRTYGSSNPNTLTFGFEPKIVFVVGRVFLDTSNTKTQLGVFNMLALTDEYLQAGYFEYDTNNASSPSGAKYAKKNGNTLSWYSTDSSTSQMNGTWSKDVSTYTYFAFA